MTACELVLAVATNLRAAFKRFLAWLRGESLIDIRLLPPEIRAALAPVVRPTVRYLTVTQAQCLVEAACTLIVSYERVFAAQAVTARTEASLGVAHAMAALAYQPAERLPAEFERQLAAARTR